VSGVRIEKAGALAVLRLDKARGNAIDEPLAEELARAAAEVAKDTGVRGVLLASAHPKVFCPGLDLVSLSGYDRPSMERFMTSFAVTVWALFGLAKPVVAAVGGAAVAGGCILALTADHRILKRGAPIGLNEVKVGVPLPWSVTLLLRASVPAPALGRIALLGRNFSDEQALAVGLADELCEADGFEAACLERLAEFAEKDLLALGATKAWLREGVLREMQAHEAAHLGVFLDGWFAPATQERIRATVASLGSRP
jgi:enoyl-CoA hydratase/carnithine racemase